MKISSFRITNYKSFIDSGRIELSDGFNVIVGQNNVGKTALLNALTLQFTGKPHRSLRTKPTETTVLNPISRGEVTLVASGQEVREILLQSQSFPVPLPSGMEFDPKRSQEVLSNILSVESLTFSLALITQQDAATAIIGETFPQAGPYVVDSNHYFQMTPLPDKSGFQWSSNVSNSGKNLLGVQVAEILRSRIYRFHAERLNVGSCPTGNRDTLAENASNLPEVLNVLQANHALFQRFNHLVNEVFPSIYEISVRPKLSERDRLEILVWTHDPNTARIDLAIELEESGTGVGQALAILYVVLTSKYPRTILIDEPNSFLHPAAAKKLIELLKREFHHHQYIITSHSPEILRAANPESLIMLRWEPPETILQPLDIEKLADLQKVLVEVGAKLADVFGADYIFWVEGDTEEDCLRLLLIDAPEMRGVNIVGVRSTGDFQSKRVPPEAIVAIYDKLSKGRAIVPPAVGFVFDQEMRTERQMQELRERTGEKLHFLPRRMYENYVLNPTAISALMNSLESFRGTPITTKEVKNWIERCGRAPKYCSPPLNQAELSNLEWLRKLDAAKLLEDLFQDLSQGRYQFNKREHCYWLTEWLLKYEPQELHELKKWLLGVLRH